jgi:hypothetical protein
MKNKNFFFKQFFFHPLIMRRLLMLTNHSDSEIIEASLTAVYNLTRCEREYTNMMIESGLFVELGRILVCNDQYVSLSLPLFPYPISMISDRPPSIKEPPSVKKPSSFPSEIQRINHILSVIMTSLQCILNVLMVGARDAGMWRPNLYKGAVESVEIPLKGRDKEDELGTKEKGSAGGSAGGGGDNTKNDGNNDVTKTKETVAIINDFSNESNSSLINSIISCTTEVSNAKPPPKMNAQSKSKINTGYTIPNIMLSIFNRSVHTQIKSLCVIILTLIRKGVPLLKDERMIVIYLCQVLKGSDDSFKGYALWSLSFIAECSSNYEVISRSAVLPCVMTFLMNSMYVGGDGSDNKKSYILIIYIVPFLFFFFFSPARNHKYHLYPALRFCFLYLFHHRDTKNSLLANSNILQGFNIIMEGYIVGLKNSCANTQVSTARHVQQGGNTASSSPLNSTAGAGAGITNPGTTAGTSTPNVIPQITASSQASSLPIPMSCYPNAHAYQSGYNVGHIVLVCQILKQLLIDSYVTILPLYIEKGIITRMIQLTLMQQWTMNELGMGRSIQYVIFPPALSVLWSASFAPKKQLLLLVEGDIIKTFVTVLEGDFVVPAYFPYGEWRSHSSNKTDDVVDGDEAVVTPSTPPDSSSENAEEQSIYYSTLWAIENILERLHTYQTNNPSSLNVRSFNISCSFQPTRIIEPVLVRKLEECNFVGVINNIVNNRDSYGDAATDLAMSIMDEYLG